MLPKAQNKTSHKDAVAAAAKSKSAAQERMLAEEFVRTFYQQAPEEDLIGWTPDVLAGIAEDMFAFATVRQVGEHKVRVYNPQEDDAASVHPTVIEIVSDDMAFIVDSISSDLAFRGFHMDTVFHPVLNVVRDAQGRMSSVSAETTAREGCVAESYIYIKLEQVLSEQACRKLTGKLNSIMEDVRAATTDWKAMLSKMDEIIEEMRAENADADVSEGRCLLSYLRGNNFTFLGYRASRFEGQKAFMVKNQALGILSTRDEIALSSAGASAELCALEQAKGPVMVSKLIGKYSTVHRRVPMDAISVKICDKDGKIKGMHLFVGLFTSSTYSCRTGEVPVVRMKVQDVIARAGFREGSHDRNALSHILEKMPRDELFHMSSDALHTLALGILRLQAKHSVALFTHPDSLQEYMSCLVYVPRDRYNTQFRLKAGKILEEALGGKLVNHFTTLDDSALARLLLNIKLGQKKTGFDLAAVERQLIELGREWQERLRHLLITTQGRAKGAELAAVYGNAFGSAYQEAIDIGNTLHDIRQMELLHKNHEAIRVDLYRLAEAPMGELRLKVYHRNKPVALCDILPMLENMGLRALSETPFESRPDGREHVWIHDFRLECATDINLDTVKDNFEETFLRVWHGQAESDNLNQLVTSANFAWREVMILRGYSAFMRQARFPYSQHTIEQTLNAWPHVASAIISLFKTLHDPDFGQNREKESLRIGAEIDAALVRVEKLDHDRILRGFRTLVEKTLRTNYFHENKECLAFKLASQSIEALPLPRPHVEIFVYSPRVEAVHLRNGEIARGGIRWSDRHDDFRTEVLSLMKAQTVKNTVIVPTGAKGGFVVKQPPKAANPAQYREAFQQEGIACYKIFVQAMLDITDNNVKGEIVRPRGVVCHDDVDPYLVVAADKGTAKFSNIANELSLKNDFWLGDAFASGGSTGYDHKGIAITARGGWESVKRHFREMGKNTQTDPFTLVGVGDMAGDVFGNAMLLSKQMKLLGAFNHVHIFCDPTPDIAVSFAERKRLFETHGGWDAYDKTKLSQGGAVFERSAKTITLSPQIQQCFGLEQEKVTPDDLIKAILKAEVDLIWFGGIGTFLKSAKQSHADADDKANDSLRIDAVDVRAKVIGEGANLGVTQLARVEYARKGGRINTDFVDNSGGVDCSDHEVNIKILLNAVMGSGHLTMEARNKLLEDMTDEVASLVLADNYQQTQSLSLQETMSKEQLGLHAKLIRILEKQNLIRRNLEGLPDEEAILRLAREGQGLTRPDLCVLTSWAKIDLYKAVISSTLPDNPALDWALTDYFPAALRQYGDAIRAHQLRREIVATQVVNMIVNRMGPVFVLSREEKTAAPQQKVAQAFLVAVEAFGLRQLWQSVESLDGRIPAAAQMAGMQEIHKVCKRAVTWFLRFGPADFDMSKEIDAFAPGIAQLKKSVGQLLPREAALALKASTDKLIAIGMPELLAANISIMSLLSSACDIVHIARKTGDDLKVVAEAYFLTGERLHIGWLKEQASTIAPLNSWQARVIGSLMDDYYQHQAALTALILQSPQGGKDGITRWFDAHAETVDRFGQTVVEIRAQAQPQLEMLVLAGQKLGQMAACLK